MLEKLKKKIEEDQKKMERQAQLDAETQAALQQLLESKKLRQMVIRSALSALDNLPPKQSIFE